MYRLNNMHVLINAVQQALSASDAALGPLLTLACISMVNAAVCESTEETNPIMTNQTDEIRRYIINVTNEQIDTTRIQFLLKHIPLYYKLYCL